jgi:hypothetical protein
VFGVEGLVDRVLWRLQTGMPGKLQELRGRYGVLDGSLEDITTWLTHEPDDVAIDKPPMVIVVEQESDVTDGPLRLTADGGGGAAWMFRYRLTVFAYARGSTFDTTALNRRRYGLAVRELLLQMPGLGAPDPGTMVLDPGNIMEAYSEVARDGRTRQVLAATSIAVRYDCQEYLGPLLPGAGTAEAIPPVVAVAP